MRCVAADAAGAGRSLLNGGGVRMDGKAWLELLGYAASVLVAVSLMMSRIVRLRVINLVGSLAFTAYGVLIGAYPVAAVNGFIVLINLWFLARMLRAKEYSASW